MTQPDMESARKLLASVFDALNLNPCVVNGANYHRATEVVAQALEVGEVTATMEDRARELALYIMKKCVEGGRFNNDNVHAATAFITKALTLARAEALEEAAKLAEVYKHETPFSPFGLATRIRSLSSQPTTPAPGKGMTREELATHLRETFAVPKPLRTWLDEADAKLKGKG